MKRLSRFRKAAALPFVLLLVALNVIVVVALLVYATTELQASRNSGQAEVARALAQSGIDIAASLIAANSTDNGFVTYQRVISNSPTDFRLETKVANVAASDSTRPWDKSVTNPTILHSGFASGTNGVDLNFGVAGDTTAGFIAPRTNLSGWTNLSTNMFRMEWIYVYKGDTNNPQNLVGRIAYWVDDESSKLNMNYSGATNIYAGDWIRTGLYGPRGHITNNANLANQEFSGNLWPLFMEMGGTAGLSTVQVNEILKARGNPIWRSDDNVASVYKPYPSPLAVRLATLPPATGGMGITTTLQQGELGFTTTMYSREPELTFERGLPRFDMFDFTMSWEPGSVKREAALANFRAALAANYPAFEDKYSIPQFAAAISAAASRFDNEAKAVKNFPYIPTGGETTNYNNRALPLINETGVRLEVKTDGTNQTSVLEANVELISLTGASDTPYNLADVFFDELAVAGSRHATNRSKYTAVVDFSPPLMYGTNITAQLILKPRADIASGSGSTNYQWIYNSKGDTNSLKIYDQNLTGCFGVLSVAMTNIATNSPTNLIWKLPSTVTTSIYYSGTNITNRYQSVSANITGGPVLTNQTNILSHTDLTSELVFHLVAQTKKGGGVRGDPRLGLHEGSIVAAPANTNISAAVLLSNSATNSDASIQALNNTWEPGGFESASLSPDITPPYTVFESDRGIPYSYKTFFLSSGVIGEIPITTYKGGNHLAWSTPRFWGDGRTNMAGVSYPPDWLMLDCVHTSMFPPDTNRIFTDATNTFISYGRININGLKSFFRETKGSPSKAENILDSLFVRTDLKDFNDWDLANQPPNGGSVSRPLKLDEVQRTNLVKHVLGLTEGQNYSNRPFLTPFEFTAVMPTFTNITNYPSKYVTYSPGSTNTSDRRLEAVVRSMQQRVTTHGNQFSIFSLAQALQVTPSGQTNVVGEAYLQAVYERAPMHNEATGAITNGSATGAPPMRQLYLRELRY